MPKKSVIQKKVAVEEYKPVKAQDPTIDEQKVKSLKSLKRIFTDDKICDEIIEAFYSKYTVVTDQSRKEFRLLLADISANKPLLEHLKKREITAVDLMEMQPEDRMEANMKQALEKMKKDELEKLKKLDPDTYPDSYDLVCKRCGSKKIHEYQRQTRSADEPMTRICTCLKCEFNWKQSC